MVPQARPAARTTGPCDRSTLRGEHGRSADPVGRGVGREWVVIDSHPGASSSAHGALSVADVVIAPTTLRTYDLNATEGMVKEVADCPLILVPNMVPRVPPAAEIARLGRIAKGTPIQVGPPIPTATAVGIRKKRVAMTSEPKPAKAITPVVTALTTLAEFVKEYVR